MKTVNVIWRLASDCPPTVSVCAEMRNAIRLTPQAANKLVLGQAMFPISMEVEAPHMQD
eukprot:CAMPEP_0195044222 /NCGR_PEP_ID=MMETSP0347-20130606/7777_1 /TAXON_ID=2932 /ORGANISM="Alexandrium fundyense, Strain CCMP1719" /LENGTH=58 /DNA_ID=CAMNT_0040071787 /DNA_START=22 /DNA_END=195 /DNA_ORIENTATION=+